MTLNNKPPLGENFASTNFRLLQMDYKQHILDIEPGPRESIPECRSDISYVQSKRILFADMSFLICIEMSNKIGELLQYYYEWYNPARLLIMKFHTHYHSEDTPEAIRKFDPFHLHKKADPNDLKLTVREPNDHFRTLHPMINLILQNQYAIKHY